MHTLASRGGEGQGREDGERDSLCVYTAQCTCTAVEMLNEVQCNSSNGRKTNRNPINFD